jgi:Kef-type K+ transport system membrane component KefB
MNAAFSFLPTTSHWVADDVLWAGIALLFAGVFGEVGWRRWRIPRVSGYGLVGVLAGLCGVFNKDSGAVATLLPDARLLVDVALGVLLFQLGGHVSLRWIRNNPWLIVMSVAEATLSLLSVAGLAMLCGVAPMTAWILGALAMASAPAMLLHLRGELRAQGQVSERMLVLSGLNSIYAVLAVKLCSAWPHQVFYGDLVASLLQPIYLIVGSVIVGLVLAATFHLLGTYLVVRTEWGMGSRQQRVDFVPAGTRDRSAGVVMLYGPVLIGIGVCNLLKLSPILAMLVAGMVFSNQSERPRGWARETGSATWLITVILFVLTTETFRWSDFSAGVLIAVVVLAARAVSKIGVSTLLARRSGIGVRKGIALGIALTPMSSIAFVLMSDTFLMYPAFDPRLKAIVLCAVVVSQLVLPACVYRALQWVQEAPRLPGSAQTSAGGRAEKDRHGAAGGAGSIG